MTDMPTANTGNYIRRIEREGMQMATVETSSGAIYTLQVDPDEVEVLALSGVEQLQESGELTDREGRSKTLVTEEVDGLDDVPDAVIDAAEAIYGLPDP